LFLNCGAARFLFSDVLDLGDLFFRSSLAGRADCLRGSRLGAVDFLVEVVVCSPPSLATALVLLL
jgi:hypothetical protein